MPAKRSSKRGSRKNSRAVSKKELAKLIVESDPQPLGRILYLTGEMTEDSITTLISEIVMCVNQNKIDPITLLISTTGGSVDDMFSLYDIMKFVPCPIHTVGLGKVESAGVLILASGNKGTRMIGKHARVMVHCIRDEIMGDIFQVKNEIKETERSQKMLEEALILETKMTQKQMESFMKVGHDAFLSAEEALKMGIVDKIIG